MTPDASNPGTADLSAELRSAVSRVYRRFRSERAHGELGDAAVNVVLHLQKEGAQSLTALSEHARVTPGSMSQTVNRLTEAGYAVRRPDPGDGRRVLFALTPEGDALARELRARSTAWFDGELDRFTPQERALLREAAVLLERIAAN